MASAILTASAEDVLEWSGITEDGSSIRKSARLPRVIFVRWIHV